MNLDFLKNVTLAAGQSLAVKAAKPKVTVGKNPIGKRIRLFYDGSIYPSQELVEQFKLEYVSKGDEVTPANGFDVVDTRKFPNYLQLKSTNPSLPDLLLIGAVAKSEPKVDMFGTCTFISEEDAKKDPSLVLNSPKSSVLEQGSNTFGKNGLIPLLKELYGFEFTKEQRFIDLIINTDFPVSSPDNITFVPKRIVRGEKIGQDSYERRENMVFYPLVIDTDSIVTAENTQESTEDDAVVDPSVRTEVPTMEEELVEKEMEDPQPEEPSSNMLMGAPGVGLN